MFRRLIFPNEVTDQEARSQAQPAALATMVLCGYLVLSGSIQLIPGESGTSQILMGVAGILYAVAIYYVIVPYPARLQRSKWPITLINVAAVSVGMVFIPVEIDIIPRIILVLIAAIMVTLWDRAATYAYLFGSLVVRVALASWGHQSLITTMGDFSFFLLAGIVVTTLQQLGEANRNRVKRLQAINEFSRQVGSSLETEQVLSLVGEALQKAIRADTYFFGLIEAGQIRLHLLYDDGEYFSPMTAPIEGTLSGWVARNQCSLFIPDLRNDVDLEGVKLVLLGKDKTNLCWMGTPIRAQQVDGIIAVGSYTPNDFNRTDLELLENLAQQTALALANTYRHAEVEAQSRLDSLTGIYNHGYIVNILNHEAENGLVSHQPVTLIMLDIDYFKRYNDNFGHQIGDQVLTVLTQAIRQHIKSSDAVGRWGGEEFAIVLPGTNGPQAQQVAERVRETINSLFILDRNGQQLPFPTVSQGLAVFPDEASDVYKLIDLADQRLYVAKERGRNQIEPEIGHWKYIK